MRGRVFLTLWLSVPVVMIAGLMYAVSYWVDHGPAGGWRPERVGAGAGETGGANAIGELRKKHDKDREAARQEDGASEPSDGGG